MMISRPLAIFLIALFLGSFLYPAPINRGLNFINSKAGIGLPNFPETSFRLGLDLLGGTHLTYQANLSNIDRPSAEIDSSLRPSPLVPDFPLAPSNEQGINRDSSAVRLNAKATSALGREAMNGVRDVIERRVNLFGVSEPVVQIEGSDRLIVELAGIKDVNQAIQLIGETPFLEFKEERDEDEIKKAQDLLQKGEMPAEDPFFKTTELTGRHVRGARVDFGGPAGTLNPQVLLELTDEGGKIFESLTERNLNKRIAIYLDGQPISVPVVQDVIRGGSAVISGNFSIQEARQLSTRLNAGALPVPIKLISQQTVGASLGQDSLAKSLKAGLVGFLMVAIFMILFYRLPGIVAVYALAIYIIFVLAIYKFLPVTLTLAGIAGFVLSLGIAVDANILIFARMREELKDGKSLRFASEEGFRRAWLSIRDSHVTTLLGSLVLYVFTTSIVKGFALTLGIGVLMSLFTAIFITRENLKFFLGPRFEKHKRLFR